MFAFWGTTMARLRWLVLVLAVVFLAVAGVWGTTVFGRLSGSSSLDDPSSESQRINQRIVDEVGPQSQDFVALYASDTLSVTDPGFRGPVESVVARVRQLPGVASVTSYYQTGAKDLVSRDGHQTYLTVRLAAHSSDGVAKKVRRALTAPGLSTQVGGQRAVDLAINGKVGADIGRAEEIGTPILTLLLLFVFGNLVAALMPVVIGGFAVLGAFLAVRVLTIFTPVSIFSVNIITILGLGLAVDYGLFVVSRFREELDKGRPVPEAVSRTVATAGRTVAVSGVLVGLALSSLMIFPQVLLRSMGMGGAAAALIAMLASLTVLPALLAVLGHRIDALRLPGRRRRPIRSVTGTLAGASAAPDGRWGRIAGGVMRRPVLCLAAVVAVLAVLTLPFARVHFGGIDERMLPAGTTSRVVSERLAADFDNGGIRPIRVLISDAAPAAAADFQHRIDAIAGVDDSVVAAARGSSTLLTVNCTGDASSPHAREIVNRIRALPAPAGATVMVGGSSAAVNDQLHSLTSRLPWMALLVGGIAFVLLALAFGSLVVPVKAIVMNLLSIGAAFGVLTWIFQDGHLSGLLHFTPTGYVEASQPILVMAILFGLSMDYEVFLLSRIRERWDELGDNTAAVVSGVQRTGGIITTAAVLLCVVVGAFATSSITFIKMIGVGIVVALLVDATLVRLLLVPATMRLLGRFNWWAPPFLRAAYARFGFSEDNSADGSDDGRAGGSAAHRQTDDTTAMPSGRTALLLNRK
ncbi:MAG: MMPL family transporter [Actinobacteria bacterium]|nr:MMPL family transporter [Actinomycetota bacterium]